jgi:hypothetical protein
MPDWQLGLPALAEYAMDPTDVNRSEQEGVTSCVVSLSCSAADKWVWARRGRWACPVGCASW